MNLIEKHQTFEIEISKIKDDNIKMFVLESLSIVPDYFFMISASSTGKHHPSYALGEGGLVRHTKAAVGIALNLFNLEMMRYSQEQKDCIIASIILHDTFKNGPSYTKYTVTEHPKVAAEKIFENQKAAMLLNEDQKSIIYDCIVHHMGQWITDFNGKEVLEKPQTKIANFVHLCDYLASRKCLEYNFEVKE